MEVKAMNTQIKDIGMRLQSLREDFEISIEEMASKLGEDIEIYKKYENIIVKSLEKRRLAGRLDRLHHNRGRPCC